MKKVMMFFCAASIASTPFTPSVQALEKENNLTKTAEKQEETTSQVLSVQSGEVEALTLERILKDGLENHHNLVMLKYELEAAKNQTLNEMDGKNDIERDISNLYKKLDQLEQEKSRLEDDDIVGKAYNSQQRDQIIDAILKLEQTIASLKVRIKQLESGEFQLGLQQEEVKAALTLKLTSDYVNLLNLQQQRDLMKEEIQEAEKEVQRAESRYKYGIGSKEEWNQAKRSQMSAEKQLEKQEKQHQHNLASLAFHLGIEYKPTLYVAPVEFDLKEEKADDIKMLIENTFQMKRAKNQLELAKFNRAEVYKDFSSSEYAKKEQDYRLKAAEENINIVDKELNSKIKELYYQAETTKFEYEEALRQLNNGKEDMAALEKRYRFGVISKSEYEKALFQVEQLSVNSNRMKLQHFLVQESINALKKGYIQ